VSTKCTLVIIVRNVARNYKTNIYAVLVQTNEGKRPLGKPRGGQNITTYFEKNRTRGCGLVSSPKGQVKMAGCSTGMKPRISPNVVNLLTLTGTVSFYRRVCCMDSASHVTFTTAAFLVKGTMTAIAIMQLFVVCLNSVTSIRQSSLRLSNKIGCPHIDRLQSLLSLLLYGYRVL
jgi:hypothetical protein